MKAVNKDNVGNLKIDASYMEVHELKQALVIYRLRIERDYGEDSSEFKCIENMLDALRNPEVK